MDYPTTDQAAEQPIVEPNVESMSQPVEEATPAPHALWYLLAALVVIAAALAFWYFYVMPQQPVETAVETGAGSESLVAEMPLPALSDDTTTADISNDLDQIPDDSAALDADVAASTQDIQGL